MATEGQPLYFYFEVGLKPGSLIGMFLLNSWPVKRFWIFFSHELLPSVLSALQVVLKIWKRI